MPFGLGFMVRSSCVFFPSFCSSFSLAFKPVQSAIGFPYGHVSRKALLGFFLFFPLLRTQPVNISISLLCFRYSLLFIFLLFRPYRPREFPPDVSKFRCKRPSVSRRTEKESMLCRNGLLQRYFGMLFYLVAF